LKSTNSCVNKDLTLEKPDLDASLDHLGPTEVMFLGLDKHRGLLVADNHNAISICLTKEAASVFAKASDNNLSSLIGRKFILNPKGKKVD
jgi:hypothetical protein